MSKKFMRIRRIAISVISLIIMMSSIVGCSIFRGDEVMDLINEGDKVIVEEAEPVYQTPQEAVPQETEIPQEPIPAVTEVSEVDEIGVVAIDPNTRPSDIHQETYGQIWAYVDESYRESVKSGMSAKEAFEMADLLASIFVTSLADLNRLVGYEEIGYVAPVAVKPSTPSTPNTPSKPSQPTPSKSEPKNVEIIDGVAYPLSQYGYGMTPWDTDGNGINDGVEDCYIKSDSTVSLPSGTENPLSMP